MTMVEQRWPVLGRHECAVEWLQVWADLGRAPRTIDAYSRALAEFLYSCERAGVDPGPGPIHDVVEGVFHHRARFEDQVAAVFDLVDGVGEAEPGPVLLVQVEPEAQVRGVSSDR